MPIRNAISKDQWKGSYLLEPQNYTLLTDAAPTYTVILFTDRITDLVVDVNINKGATVVITPILSNSDDTKLGKPSDTGTIADLGANSRFIYSKFCAPKAKVVVTKTEAGDSTTTEIAISGLSL